MHKKLCSLKTSKLCSDFKPNKLSKLIFLRPYFNCIQAERFPAKYPTVFFLSFFSQKTAMVATVPIVHSETISLGTISFCLMHVQISQLTKERKRLTINASNWIAKYFFLKKYRSKLPFHKKKLIVMLYLLL